jgi:hypothetical protein
MTLVLTNVTEYGMVMAADDALAERVGGDARILFGATKLLAHYKCHCGFATWGAGGLPHGKPNSPPVAMEFILKRFLRDNLAIESIDELLERLVRRLNDHPESSYPAMIDIAACVQTQASWNPVIYQLGNCDDAYVDQPVIRPFAVRIVRRPEPYNPLKDTYPFANGVLNVGWWVDAQFDAMIAAGGVTEKAHLVPGDSLEKRQAFLGSVARAISDVHVTMDLSRSIGPRVMTLGISSTDGNVCVRE